MSRWTHAICPACWLLLYHGVTDLAALLVSPNTQTCCFCGLETDTRIFVRADPAKPQCGGVRGIHLEKSE
jgi:hypothetical protein